MLEEEKQPQKEDSCDLFQGLPKLMFFMGLFAGLALFSSVMLGYLVWSVSTGKGMLAVGAGQVAQAPVQVAGADQEAPLQQPAVPVRGPDETDHVYGPANAPITLIEYSDFECPYCKRHFETVNQIKAEYKDKVRIVFRHFPLDFHPNAQKAAEASECAADVGGNDAFWKMHDKIFTAEDITVAGLKNLAKEIGLNEGKFNECLDSGKMANVVLAQADEATTFGVQGTPANFINGQEVTGGARPFADFKSAIDSILAQ